MGYQTYVTHCQLWTSKQIIQFRNVKRNKSHNSVCIRFWACKVVEQRNFHKFHSKKTFNQKTIFAHFLFWIFDENGEQMIFSLPSLIFPMTCSNSSAWNFASLVISRCVSMFSNQNFGSFLQFHIKFPLKFGILCSRKFFSCVEFFMTISSLWKSKQIYFCWIFPL